MSQTQQPPHIFTVCQCDPHMVDPWDECPFEVAAQAKPMLDSVADLPMLPMPNELAQANTLLANSLQSLSESIRSMAFSVDALAQTQKPNETSPMESPQWSPGALSKMLSKDAVPFEFPKLRRNVEVESPRVKVLKLEEGEVYTVQNGVVVQLEKVYGEVTDGEMSPFWLWLEQQKTVGAVSTSLRTILNTLLRSRGVG